jgi:hypothetical protein
VTRQLALVGVVSAAFGIGAYQMLEQLSLFSIANMLLAVATLGLALASLLRGLGTNAAPALRGPMLRALVPPIAAAVAAILLYQLAAASHTRFDWTFENRFELADATKKVLAELPGTLHMTLYFAGGDPRIRHTQLALETMAAGHDVSVASRDLDRFPDEEDHFGIGSSNSVVLELDDRWALIERPTQGALYEGIARLVNAQEQVIYFSVGAGEGNLDRSDDAGYSGLHFALENEGYEVLPLPLAVLDEIPEDAAAIVLIAPRRRILEPAIDALNAYVEAGGPLVVFLEPGSDSGVEDLLAQYGLRSADALVVDPASAPLGGGPPGLNPIAHNYAEHPVTRGLHRNRMTYFRGARAFELHKRSAHDRLRAVVLSSGDAWLHPTTEPRGDIDPLDPPEGVRRGYHNLVVAAELSLSDTKARILAFGDSDLANNRNLRALYNLDLVINGIHWAVEREAAITLRPKIGGRELIQFPIPLQQSLGAFHGTGLLVPELLILIGGLIWLRQRRA